jgi:hypothetical protein
VIPFIRPLLQSHFACCNHRDLGHREDAVGEYEQENDDELDAEAAHSSRF